MPRLLIIFLPPLVLALASACNGDSGPAVTNSPTNGETATAEATRPDGGPNGAPAATPVVLPQDTNAFIALVGGRELIRELCDAFDPATSVADCGERGLFKPGPLPPPDDAKCGVLLADGELIGLSCTSAQFQNVNIYVLTP